ncbi:MAG: Transcriptional regulator, MarR family [Candidatus Daviesbacteria bacterium GW2011_GWA2_38_24]|uniref:Transcriptional regulator, MarR family n=1 Tax=Candidatus Daviesbacteria bacterium GW2011_GWA2_38_24 TaxID=1618422 RepID=A0A0G0LZP3_9BACT|nr:MAG: Transcriptional regulator, MarR family [Candidatus Daviesbacteria bacterium GW2011_GWA2_38_24]KKQ80239.1 MAG: Transcriptional regulator, MarR family [Candidatus Daviesbacteria bacterium GW2011_GWA1_38_7]
MSNRKHLIEELLHSFHSIRNIIRFHALHASGHQNHITHSQWFVLKVIDHLENPRVKDVSEALSMSSSATTQLVEPLVQAGFVLRKEDPKDRRLVQLQLSLKGKKQIAAKKEECIAEMGMIFEGLTDKELEEFVRLHKKITLNLSKRKS